VQVSSIVVIKFVVPFDYTKRKFMFMQMQEPGLGGNPDPEYTEIANALVAWRFAGKSVYDTPTCVVS